MTDRLIDEVARNLDIDEREVRAVIDEFGLQLHKRALEYKGLNGDYIGEELWTEIDPQAFYHLLGFLDYFAERYSWSPASATQYLLRLGRQLDWLPYRHQMLGWKMVPGPRAERA